MIEALVALMVMSFGMVALVGLMGNLRRSGDLAKQRSEAMRLAQAETASLRSFSVVRASASQAASGVKDYDNDIVTLDARSLTPENSNSTFQLYRDVTPLVKDKTEPQAQTVSVKVAWKDRSGASETLTLATVISRTDPSFGGALGVTPPTNSIRVPDGRNAAIPVAAKDLGNKSSAFRPSSGSPTVWVFNNITGVITGKCSIDIGTAVSSLTPGDVDTCKNNTVGYLVGGTIRFSDTRRQEDIAPAAPAGTALPLSVYLSLAPSEFTVRDADGAVTLAPGGAYPITPNHECFSDAPVSSPSTQTLVNYNCIVYPNTQSPRNWWGQVLLGGLNLGTDDSHVKVCRYSADYNGNARIDNEEHPATYRGVSYSLVRQNFLVIRGSLSCPTASIDTSAGIFVDYTTYQLQPG